MAAGYRSVIARWLGGNLGSVQAGFASVLRFFPLGRIAAATTPAPVTAAAESASGSESAVEAQSAAPRISASVESASGSATRAQATNAATPAPEEPATGGSYYEYRPFSPVPPRIVPNPIRATVASGSGSRASGSARLQLKIVARAESGAAGETGPRALYRLRITAATASGACGETAATATYRLRIGAWAESGATTEAVANAAHDTTWLEEEELLLALL